MSYGQIDNIKNKICTYRSLKVAGKTVIIQVFTTNKFKNNVKADTISDLVIIDL